MLYPPVMQLELSKYIYIYYIIPIVLSRCQHRYLGIYRHTCMYISPISYNIESYNVVHGNPVQTPTLDIHLDQEIFSKATVVSRPVPIFRQSAPHLTACVLRKLWREQTQWVGPQQTAGVAFGRPTDASSPARHLVHQ